MQVVRKCQNSEKVNGRLLPSMLYEQNRVAPMTQPGPATVVEELNYRFPAAMVSVVPTCVGLLYENLHTVLHWPSVLGIGEQSDKSYQTCTYSN